MKIRCQCGAIYNVPETTCGKNVTCKKCTTTFVCPTPPPKPNIGVGAQSQNPNLNQNVPPTFVSSPYGRKKKAKRTNTQEDEILKKYMSEEKSLEERMQDRRAESIEEDRTSNSLSFILVGGAWLLGAIVVGIALWSMTGAPTRGAGVGRRRGAGRAIMALLYWTGGKYWVPPILALWGLYKIGIGVMSLFKVVDIQSQQELPDKW